MRKNVSENRPESGEKKKRLRAGDKVLITVTACILLLSLFIISPLSERYLSLAVMSVYSRACAKEGLPATEGIELKIPGGGFFSRKGWYPFVITFVPGKNYGESINDPGCSLTILYNIADFDPIKGCSRLFDPGDPLYSSFYGAYLVKCDNGRKYGFSCGEDGEPVALNVGEVANIARYDYQYLVLSGFGLDFETAVFSFETKSQSGGVSYAGSDGWFLADAELTVNGCAHRENGFVQSYLCYGVPKSEIDDPLAPVAMYGRVYGKYLRDKGVGVFFYIIAADKQALEDCDRTILSKSTLK